MRTRNAVLLTVLAVAALPVAPAAAADIEVSGTTSVTYTAAAGAANRITVDGQGSSVTITDAALSKRPSYHGADGAHCNDQTLGLTCDVTAGVAVRILGGDGDDTVTVTGSLPVRIEGGAGDDVLIGGGGADRLRGDAGNDRLAGGDGADRIEGGDGTDVVDYGSSLLAVRVTPDGSDGDGALGEGDDVETDVEGSVGGAGGDELTAGADGGTVDGGAGGDDLHGGPGLDTIFGGDGDDRIFAADGRSDTVVCGGGADTVTSDALDAVAADCESGATGAEQPTSDRGRGTSSRGSTGGDDSGGKPLAPVGRDDTPRALDVDQIAPVVEQGVALPQLGRRVSVAPAAGVVRVTAPGERSERLSDGASLPVGAVVDTTRGVVTLTAAANAAGALQTARFQGAKFRVTQTKGTTPITELTLAGPSARCAPRGRTAVAAAKRRPSVRRLWGSGHGNFRTRGRYAAATVRGTIWLTEDRCDGTLVSVRRGLVAVRDKVRRTTVAVPAGKRYLARAR